MLRSQFSYWLTAEPGDGRYAGPERPIEDVIDALRDKSVLVPEGMLTYGTDGFKLSAEVNERLGTIEQDDGIRAAVEETAAAFPGYKFTLLEKNEDDKSNGRYSEWDGGTRTKTRTARVVGPEDEYDPITANAIVRFLADEDVPQELLDAISSRFANGRA